VLSQGYKVASDEIADAVRRLTNAANVVVNRVQPSKPGLRCSMLAAISRMGLLAYEGLWLGDVCHSTKKAVKRLTAQSKAACLLG
jgi:hypothetical protein